MSCGGSDEMQLKEDFLRGLATRAPSLEVTKSDGFGA